MPRRPATPLPPPSPFINLTIPTTTIKKTGIETIISFDPGSVNCGQIIVEKNHTNGTTLITKPKVYNFSTKGDTSLTRILEKVHIKLNRNSGVRQYLFQRSKDSPIHVLIENQEGINPGRGKFQLARALIRMGTIAGAIAMYFLSKGIKVSMVNKGAKWVKKGKTTTTRRKKKGGGTKNPPALKSPQLKALYKSSALYMVKKGAKTSNETKKTLVWLQTHKSKAQHVCDAIVQALHRTEEEDKGGKKKTKPPPPPSKKRKRPTSDKSKKPPKKKKKTTLPSKLSS